MKPGLGLQPIICLSVLGLAACCIAPVARAASSGDVECKLPAQLHTVGGHATLGAGRIVQTSPEDCRQRGGEYTVSEASPASSPAVASAVSVADTGPLVYCLLPAQTRQLGEKDRYKTTRRSIRTARADCLQKGGKVYTPRKARATRKKP
ncbi:MAG: hypothetical protein JSR34_01115 [Proteobacteria bacterium]|nr:hypothetical protein [Pseudomonadota bacterium]